MSKAYTGRMDMTDTLFRLHDRLQFLECCFQHLVVLAQTIPVTPTIQTIETSERPRPRRERLPGLQPEKADARQVSAQATLVISIPSMS